MEQDALNDKTRGCLMAGAAGDALGYEVEFMSRSEILSRFDEQGITKFALDRNGKALISDDTQMTLFTANGLLTSITRSTSMIHFREFSQPCNLFMLSQFSRLSIKPI